MILPTLAALTQQIKSIFPALAHSLNPPANQAQVEQAESRIGYALPESLKALYLTHNGESDGHGLFLGMRYLSIEEALHEWQNSPAMAAKTTPQAENKPVSVPPKHIKTAYANPQYFPISKGDSGQYLVVDLDPDIEGSIGQVINIDPNGQTRHVIAHDVVGLVALMANQLAEGNYQFITEKGQQRWVLKTPQNMLLLDALKALPVPHAAIHVATSNGYETLTGWYNRLDDNWQAIIKENGWHNSQLKKIPQATSLNLMRCGLKDLTPITRFIGLRKLILTANPVRDIAPLAQLKQLKKLFLSKTSVKSLEPLNQLPKLRQLNLYNTSVRHFGYIPVLDSLRSLCVEATGLPSLHEVTQMHNLRDLDLSNNQLNGFKTLANLQHLERLNVARTNVEDIDFFADMPSLRKLILFEAPIKDYGVLGQLPELKEIVCTFEAFMVIKNLLPRKINFVISDEMTGKEREAYYDYNGYPQP